MENGYIKLWRVLLKKPIWLKSTPQQRSVLITLLLMANHEKAEWEWKGEKFKVMPGQFVTSLESIRKKAGMGISIQNVRSSLMRFQKLNFLTVRATKHGSIISIKNWGSYQPKKTLPNKGKLSKPAITMMLQKTLKSNKEPNKDDIEDIANDIYKLYKKSCGTQQRTQQRPNKGPTTNKNDKNDKNIYIRLKFEKRVSMPKNICLTDKMLEYVEKQGCSNNGYANSLFEDFKNYHGSKGTKFKDWTLAFYNWVRNDKKYYNTDKYTKLIPI